MSPKPPKSSGSPSSPASARPRGESPSRQPSDLPGPSTNLRLPSHAPPSAGGETASGPLAPRPATASASVTDIPGATSLAPDIRPHALQRYSRIAPRQLAPVDANGLRLYKQQKFVELEGHTDWVVQVEYDASVGAFRAKLRSDLLPSGPTLYRVAGSAKWSTESATATLDRYLIPAMHRGNIELLRTRKRGLSRGFSHAWQNDAVFASKRLFIDSQDLLIREATAFFSQVRLPVRPALDPDLMLATSAEQLFARIYSHHPGLVLAETHAGIGSKQLLIENMGSLVRHGVKTLYLEHLRTDFEQFELDIYQRSGTMPTSLKRYLEIQDTGHETDPSGTYSFLNLVITARSHGVNIRALDCAVSYEMSTGDGAQHRIPAMNYYADLVIKADAPNLEGGKWIALVGESHINAQQGFPGLVELEGVPGIRIEDIEDGASIRVAADPGRSGRLLDSEPYLVQSDLAVYIGVPPYSRLHNEGDFFVYTRPESQSHHLVHREGEKTRLTSIVKTRDNSFYLERSQWQNIHRERFASLAELSAALINRRGMVAVLPLDRPLVGPPRHRDPVVAGHFFIDTTPDGQHQLTHCSRTGMLIETPITHDAKGFTLVSDRWPVMAGRSFDTLDELRAALVSQVGLTPGPE
ncbi:MULTISPECIES: membrane-targeted effector domain-containing toxin [unclassified Pseudomonas]|uniref:membrane-targeted effector domain-containing toxin n=1 Tax=unclassified Pseudomonas TaxID=196821 RepID=UPI0020107E75|nr:MULTISPECIES: membrane-targeted effector domain-containing toxin [unclassified Pseudomonas]